MPKLSRKSEAHIEAVIGLRAAKASIEGTPEGEVTQLQMSNLRRWQAEVKETYSKLTGGEIGMVRRHLASMATRVFTEGPLDAMKAEGGIAVGTTSEG